MYKNKISTLFLIILVVGILVGGCTQPTTHPKLSSPTIESISTVSPTMQLSATITPTTSLTVTIIKQFTTTPTLTPRPALSAEQSEVLAIELFKSNGGCLFPCWFGYVPGINSYTDVKEFIKSFTTIYSSRLTDTFKEIYFYFPKLPGINLNMGRALRGKIHGDSQGNFVYADFEAPLTYIPIDKVLTIYGLPDEVRIYAEGWYMGLSENGTFWIVLFYPDKGIMVEYEGYMAKSPKLDICFSEKKMRPYSRLLLWDKNQKYSFTDAGKIMGLFTRPEDDINKDYQPISEISDLDIQSFYERYSKKENSEKCFQVPDRGWPVTPSP